jgi:hypothetical protein
LTPKRGSPGIHNEQDKVEIVKDFFRGMAVNRGLEIEWGIGGGLDDRKAVLGWWFRRALRWVGFGTWEKKMHNYRSRKTSFESPISRLALTSIQYRFFLLTSLESLSHTTITIFT